MATFSVINYSDSVLQNCDNKKRNIPIAPAMTSYNNILITNDAKRKAGRVKEAQSNAIKATQPPPIAVARRNARERNRVKQVNNGFAILRQHIPPSIASDTENGRSKKLSKVETLRLAVEYIRRLEDLLALTSPEGQEENDNSMSSFGSYPVVSSPSNQIPFPIKTEEDKASKLRTYQLIYEDEENIHPEMNELDDDILSETHLMESTMDLSSRNINFINSIHSTGSLSPEMNSEHSLSPRIIDVESKPFVLNEIGEDGFKLRYSMLRDASINDDNNLITMTSWWDHEQLKS